MTKRDKGRPKVGRPPSGRRKPSLGGLDPSAGYHQPLSWGLRLVDLDGPHGWRNLEGDHLVQLQRDLVGLEGRTLANLERERRAKGVPVTDLHPPAQERLRELGLDADELWELRLGSKWRVWGVVEDSVFYALWWDPHENVCGRVAKGTFRRG